MEQRLVDIMFQVAITCATDPWFKDKTQEEIAEWVRQMLKAMNINVIPVGASHGIIKK